MKISTLEQYLDDDEFIENQQKKYLKYYDEAQRESNVIGRYKGRPYITLSRKKHLDQTMAVKLCRQKEMCLYHVHNWIELSYVFSGHCQMEVLDQKHDLKEGEFILLNTQVPHCEGGMDAHSTFVNFMFDQNYFDHFFFSQITQDSLVTRFFINAMSEEKDHENFIIFHSGENERLPMLVRIVLAEYFDASICSHDILSNGMNMIFCELVNSYQKNAQKDERKSQSLRIAQILRYIENNSATCTLKSTAEFFGLSPNYMTSQLKKSVHMSFKELVQDSRLKSAARLLTETDASVREIANHVGYENIGFFNSKFKSYYGMQPGEYRRRHFQSNDKEEM